MRPGPARGETATLDVTVTDEMSASVAGERVHPVYGTAALVVHMEEVCRKILVPHLEPGEEGVGYHLEVTHREPVPIGAEVTLTATVANVGAQKLICEVMARWGTRLVARGSFEQRVVDLERFRERIAERSASV